MIQLHEFEISGLHWKSPSRFLDPFYAKEKTLRHWFFEIHTGVRTQKQTDGHIIRSDIWWNPYLYGTILGFQFGFGLLFMSETAQAWRARYLAADEAKKVEKAAMEERRLTKAEEAAKYTADAWAALAAEKVKIEAERHAGLPPREKYS